MTQLSRSLHLIALATWFGSAVFFNLLAAPSLFATFKAVVADAPSDRTANLPLGPELNADEKAKLASALAGAAVGPLFPIFFQLEGVCVVIALATAIGWNFAAPPRPVDRWRVRILILAAISIVASVFISNHVTDLRLARLSSDPTTADTAKSAFAAWHGVSLLTSFITMGMALASLVLAAKLPTSTEPAA